MLTLVISFIINLLLIIDLESNPGDYHYEGRFRTIVTILGILQIALSGVPMIMWSILKFKLETKLQRDKYIDSILGKKALSIVEKVYVNVFLSFLNQAEIFVFLFHIVCIGLAIGVSPGFFGIDLLALISLSKTLKYVIKSTTEHASQLGATYVLGKHILTYFQFY